MRSERWGTPSRSCSRAIAWCRSSTPSVSTRRLRLASRLLHVGFLETRLSERVTLVLVDVPELFDREGIYGSADGDFPDNAIRFAVFSRAALEYPRLRRAAPVDHPRARLADRPRAGLPEDAVLVGSGRRRRARRVHDPQPGVSGRVSRRDAAGDRPRLEVLDVQAIEFWGKISYLKGGINFSEQITTVSPTYASEISTPELGFGFEGVLARRSDDLVGILNGIDITRWTPTAG